MAGGKATGVAECVVACETRLGESMIWHAARQRYCWLDLLQPRLFELDPATDTVRERPLPDVAPPIGAIAATSDPDRLLLSHRRGLALLDIDTLAMTAFADPEAGRDEVTYNDMKVDRWGRLWLGSCHATEQAPRGALWCVDGGGLSVLGDVGFAVSNGPAFSPDGGTMYFNDSVARQTLAYDLAADDPHPRNRRVLATYATDEGLPDGLTVDADGDLWSAQWEAARIIRLSATGDKLETIAVAAGHVTSLAFAGENRSKLLITTAREGLSPASLARYPLSGGVFRLPTAARGLAEPLFALQ